MIQKLLTYFEKAEIFIKEKFFLEKIDSKKIRYKRKYGRDMEDDEVEQYKFKLFILSSLVVCLPIVFLIIMFFA